MKQRKTKNRTQKSKDDIRVGYVSDIDGAPRSLLSRVRFLPLMIFAAALLLPLKLNSVWEGLGDAVNRSLSVAEAQQMDAPGANLPPPGQDAATSEMMPGADAPMAAPEGVPAEAADSGATARLLNEDPTLLTQTEIDLLQQLAERREVLDARAKEFGTREGLLDAAEARIDKKIAEFKVLQATIEGLIKTYDEQQDSKMQSLVNIYENMKPKDAARIFEELDMDTLLSVAERMKERKLAPVMAQMGPAKARDVTVELSKRRDIPKIGENTGG